MGPGDETPSSEKNWPDMPPECKVVEDPLDCNRIVVKLNNTANKDYFVGQWRERVKDFATVEIESSDIGTFVVFQLSNFDGDGRFLGIFANTYRNAFKNATVVDAIRFEYSSGLNSEAEAVCENGDKGGDEIPDTTDSLRFKVFDKTFEKCDSLRDADYLLLTFASPSRIMLFKRIFDEMANANSQYDAIRFTQDPDRSLILIHSTSSYEPIRLLDIHFPELKFLVNSSMEDRRDAHGIVSVEYCRFLFPFSS